MKEISKDFLDIDYNVYDDATLYTRLAANTVSIEEKKYILDNFSERIEKMSQQYISDMLASVNKEFCEVFSDFIKKKVESFSVSQVEDLYFKRAFFHIVSDISNYLVKQDWFLAKKDSSYEFFYLEYKINELLKSNISELESDKETLDKIEDIGKIIIKELPYTTHSTTLFNMIMKDYMRLLELTNSSYKEEFIKDGYSLIWEYAIKGITLSPNMILFDCYIIKDIFGFNTPNFFNFYREDDKILAYYQFGNINFNLNGIDHVYETYYIQKEALQFLFFLISHELKHSNYLEYCVNFPDHKNDLKTALKMYYVSMAEMLRQDKGLDFYRDNHDNFYYEFDANIFGIQALYVRYKYIPQITDRDKRIINAVLAQQLYDCYMLKSNKEYMSPVDFTKKHFDEIKDNLSEEAITKSLFEQTEMPEYLKEVEDNLTDYEKFLFGYDNPYIDILKKIADGDIESTNLFEDIPKFYESRQKQRSLK